MQQYEFPGVGRFADRVAGSDHASADALKSDPAVDRIGRRVAEMAETTDDAERDGMRRDVMAELTHLERVAATARAIVDEAFPPLGFSRPQPTTGAPAVLTARESPRYDPRDAHPFEHEQMMGPDGKPVTLDPKNPAHAEAIKAAPKYGSVPSDHLARLQSGDWQDQSARRSQLALSGYSDRDLIQGIPRPTTDPETETINADNTQREYDAWERSAAGQEAMRRNRLRASGADVGMTGSPPRPNTGINQDINQRDVPTQFDKPPRSEDPFQSRNPPYTDSRQQDHGQQVKQPQGPFEGGGLTTGTVAAAADVPHEQRPGEGSRPLSGALERTPVDVPPEAQHPDFGKEPPKARGPRK